MFHVELFTLGVVGPDAAHLIIMKFVLHPIYLFVALLWWLLALWVISMCVPYFYQLAIMLNDTSSSIIYGFVQAGHIPKMKCFT
jgi:hypothetical protein